MLIEKKSFQLSSKKIYLKYKNIYKNIDNISSKIKSQLIYKLIYIDYLIIGEEDKGDSITVHCFIELKSSINTSSSYFFDIYLDGELYHGHYRAGTRKKRILEYIYKNTKYIEN
jgi:hypothetical protein